MNSRSAEFFNVNALLGVKDFITISRRVNVVMLRYWGPSDFSQGKIEHAQKKKGAKRASRLFLHLYKKAEQSSPKSNKQIENNLPKILGVLALILWRFFSLQTRIYCNSPLKKYRTTWKQGSICGDECGVFFVKWKRMTAVFQTKIVACVTGVMS